MTKKFNKIEEIDGIILLNTKEYINMAI